MACLCCAASTSLESAMSFRSILSFTVAAAFAVAPAADWPQFRGPNGDGTTDEKILTTWPDEGPKALWKLPMGEGFGAVAIVGERAYVMAERNKEEACVAIDVTTGKEVWATALGKTIFEGAGGNGPRSTPTIVGDHVYVLGTYLRLSCLSAKDGKVVWSHDIQAENNGQNMTGGIKQWGNAMSPIVEGDVVMVAGGGTGETFLFFDRKTGKLMGKHGDEKITHASPTPTEIGGQRQVVFFTQQGLTSLDAKAGAVLWHADFPFSTSTAASPLIDGDVAYCSAGYGVGAGAFQISKSGKTWKATELWRMKGKLPNHWSTPVALKGHVYGLFGFKEFKTEPLKCIEIKTGKELWSQDGFGQGGTILVGENILTQGDQGQLVLTKATPEKYTELARAQVLTGKCWTAPSVANGLVFCRSTKEIVCLDLRPK
jgi:outer membrane protein assembly factor BamB